MKANKNVTIWSNYDIDDGLAEIDFYLLQKHNNRQADIVALADVGRWNGRINGYREVDNVQYCFNLMEDYAEFYIDRHGNFRCRTSHHDGNNYILFREWKPGISDQQRDNFLQKWCRGTATGADISRYTQKLQVNF